MKQFKALFTDEELAYIEAAREFGKKHFGQIHVDNWCHEGGIPDEVMRAYKEAGIGYVGLPKEYGGLDISLLGQMAMLEELFRISGALLPLSSQMFSFNIISLLANREQMEFFVQLFEKTARPCTSIAISDVGAGSGLMACRAEVSKKGRKLMLNGSKSFIANGMFAPYLLVLARDLFEADGTANSSLSVWAIPKDSPGVSVYPINTIGQKANRIANAVFENVEVSRDWQLGSKGVARERINQVMNIGQCITGAASLGLAQAAFDDSSTFASKHYIGNERMGNLQQIGLMLTQMQIKLVSIRAHVYNAANSIEFNDDPALWTSTMKYYVPQTGVEVASMAMQIMGGLGYTDSARASRIWLDLRGNQYAFETDQVVANIAARQILKKAISRK